MDREQLLSERFRRANELIRRADQFRILRDFGLLLSSDLLSLRYVSTCFDRSTRQLEDSSEKSCR